MSVETVLVLVGAVLMAAAIVGAFRWKDSRVVVRRRVMVNLKDGSALGGVIVHADRDRVVLTTAELYEAGANGPVPLDGEVVAFRSNIQFYQQYSEA